MHTTISLRFGLPPRSPALVPDHFGVRPRFRVASGQRCGLDRPGDRRVEVVPAAAEDVRLRLPVAAEPEGQDGILRGNTPRGRRRREPARRIRQPPTIRMRRWRQRSATRAGCRGGPGRRGHAATSRTRRSRRGRARHASRRHATHTRSTGRLERPRPVLPENFEQAAAIVRIRPYRVPGRSRQWECGVREARRRSTWSTDRAQPGVGIALARGNDPPGSIPQNWSSVASITMPLGATRRGVMLRLVDGTCGRATPKPGVVTIRILLVFTLTCFA